MTTLRKGHYRFQFRQLAWTHMSIFFVVLQPHMIIENVFEGLIWYVCARGSGARHGSRRGARQGSCLC